MPLTTFSALLTSARVEAQARWSFSCAVLT